MLEPEPAGVGCEQGKEAWGGLGRSTWAQEELQRLEVAQSASENHSGTSFHPWVLRYLAELRLS